MDEGSKMESNTKIVGEKRGIAHLGEKQSHARKRVKMKDLDSVVQCSIGVKDDSKEEKIGRNKSSENVASGSLDLNTEACKSGECAENFTTEPVPEKQEKREHGNSVVSRRINLNSNVEDVASSVNLEALYSAKGHDSSKSKEVSESASCIGPSEEKDPMRMWQKMKQYGFWSPSHAGVPKPKLRGRKSKDDMLKKKMEMAKREQINRFSKLAAPSGLLNDLNPGIINHVRNKKQVHSIIEALVRSDKHESSSSGGKQAALRTSESKEVGKRDQEYVTEAGKHQVNFAHEMGRRQERKCAMTMNDSLCMLEGKVCDRDTSVVENDSLKSCVSHSTYAKEDDILALKLSSEVKGSISSTTLSNEESSNVIMVSSLSLKAATVASKWLELLHQDIKGRLSALRRSRRRVRHVINTELPFLLTKEFEDNQEYDSYNMKMSGGFSTTKMFHRARWSALFDHMDEALSEEEKQLENWLNQVKEKQLLCDQGLQHVNWSTAFGLHQPGQSENRSRAPIIDSSEKELAVNAAAASIYSTCNFLLSES